MTARLHLRVVRPDEVLAEPLDEVNPEADAPPVHTVEDAALPALSTRLTTRAGGDVTGVRLYGGVVTDPAGVAAIAARVEHYARPWWRRVGRRCPR